MARIFLAFLILADVLVGLAMANGKLQTHQSQPSSDPPAPSPTNRQNMAESKAPISRKLGRHHHYHQHHHHGTVSVPHTPTGSPSISPSIAPQAEDRASSTSENISIQNQELEIHLKRHHHSLDKSIAGGGVILGGLATTFLVALFCYIRATGRHKSEAQATV